MRPNCNPKVILTTRGIDYCSFRIPFFQLGHKAPAFAAQNHTTSALQTGHTDQTL